MADELDEGEKKRLGEKVAERLSGLSGSDKTSGAKKPETTASEKGKVGAEVDAENHQADAEEHEADAMEDEAKSTRAEAAGLKEFSKAMQSMANKLDASGSSTGRGSAGSRKKKLKLDMSGITGHAKEHWADWLLFIGLTLVHVFFDVMRDMPRDRASVWSWVIYYVFVSLLAASILNKGDSDAFSFWRKYTLFLVYGLVATFLPLFMAMAKLRWGDLPYLCAGDNFCLVTWLGIVVAFFPLYVFLVFFTSESPVKKILLGYLILFLLFLTLFYARGAIAAIPANVGTALDSGQVTSDVKETIGDTALQAVKDLFKFPQTVGAELKHMYEPYFYGTVEDNKDDERLGVFFENVEPLMPRFFLEDEEIVAYADIKAKTFANTVDLHNACYAKFMGQDRKEEIVYGTATPDTLSISDYEENTLQCVIARDDINSISEAVEIWFVSSFNFETWGTVDYVFMERNELRNRQKSGTENVALELGINEYLQAVYTNGPIMLGLVRRDGKTRLPFAIDQDNPNLPLFGVTLENTYQYRGRGDLESVEKLVFHVPKPVELDKTSCQPIQFSSQRDSEDGAYTFYEFDDVPVREDLPYHTIRCRMTLPCEQGACADMVRNDLLGASGIAIATFAAEVHYDYELKAYTGVRLELPQRGDSGD